MAVTVKDVAKLAGVSAATVSRVINNDSRISDATKEKVIECIKQLDYKINPIARSLKTNKTYTIGLVCADITNEFFMSIAKGVEDELRKNGYSMIICNSDENVAGERTGIELLAEKCVDGIIIIPVSNEGKHYSKLQEINIPFILADRVVDDFAADAVLVDNINGSYTAIEYLITRGHRHIGFIGGDMRISSARERYEGYCRAHQDYCIPLDETIIKFGDFHVDSGYMLMKELINGKNIPEYVFVSNYFMQMGATKYLIESKKSSSGGVSIAGFDNLEISTLLGISSISVKQPMIQIGCRAAELLLSRINKEELPFPQIVRLKTTLGLVK